MKRQSRTGDVIKEEKKKKAGLHRTLNLLWSQKVKDCFQFSTLSYEKRQGVTCLLCCLHLQLGRECLRV